MTNRWSFIVLSFFHFCANGQIDQSFLNKIKSSVTETINYDINNFKSDSQFWAMCEDKDGTLIFGNNEGIMVFDGEYWKKILLPNNSSVRSLMIDDTGIIWVGGYNELGVLKKDLYGNYSYISYIKELNLEGNNLENNWQIHSFNGKTVYRSFRELLVIVGKAVTHFKAYQSFLYSEVIGDNLIVQDADTGIYLLNKEADKLSLVFKPESYGNGVISAVFKKNDREVFLITKEGNIYLANLKTKKIIKKTELYEKGHIDPINCGIQKNDSTFLLGTLSSKIFELRKDGTIEKTNITFSKQKNTAIHNFYKLKSNNIWVLHNNGVSCLDFNSQYSYLFDYASVYDILIDNSTIYIASNEGIYYLNEFDQSTFKINKIEDLPGHAWSLSKVNGEIIVGHNNGLFVLNNYKSKPVENNKSGFWKITPIKNKQNLFLASNYNGLFLLAKEQSNWILKHKIDGFEESTRDIIAAEDPNTYWICHGYKGVYKIQINSEYTRVESVEHFTTNNGFKSPFNINVTNYNGKIVFTTNNGIFVYDKSTKTFKPDNDLNKIFDSSKNTRKLLYANDKTWFVEDDEVGYFINDSKKKELVKLPFLNLKGIFNKGMECVKPYDNFVFFGTNTGMFLYDINNYDADNSFSTTFSNISYIKGQVKNLALINSDENVEFPNNSDILRFEFTAPKMAPYTEVMYSYFLEGSDFRWSSWSTLSYKEYTKLRHGNYTFRVKSKSNTGIIGDEISYAFTILPTWYQTRLAYFIYVLVFLTVIVFVYRIVLKIIEGEKRKTKLETLKDQKLVKLELQQLKLSIEQKKIKEDNTHLEMDLIDKSKELANYTLLLSKRKETFLELSNDLKQLKEIVRSSESKNKIIQIFKKLSQNKIGDKYLEIFDVNFERVHANFFRDLKYINNSFTKRELRICALIKMNHTTKEISHILNISARGVETARYRIRKKLNLSSSESLTHFLENLTT